MSSKVENTNMSSWDPNQPYQGLPLLPPSSVDLESTTILKRCIGARAALAELKQAAELIPNQAMLISILPKLEAGASSEIENIVTTTDRLFQFERDEEHADPATKEALWYSQALLKGYKSLRQHPLSTRTAEEVCSIIKGVDMSVRRVPGTKLTNKKTGQVVYTPPEEETLLRDLLGNWEKFLHEQKHLDPLVRMAVAHYQFEAIHPFTDGNGRTGRALNSLFLINEKLLTLPILYLSRYLIRERDSYYRLLLEVTRSRDWEEWIIFILAGVEETSIWTKNKIGAVRTLMEQTTEYVRKKAAKIYSYELVNLIFERPYCRIQDLVRADIAERQAASKYLKELVSLGVLKEIQVGREKAFIHLKLMHLLGEESNSFESYST